MLKKIIANALIGLSLAAPAIAYGGGDQTTFAGVSGYAGGKGCEGGREGKDESAYSEKVKPSDHSVEKPGGGWAMAAVPVKMFKKLKGCEATIGGVKVKVMDTCPKCGENGKIDINHSECSQMDSSNAGKTTVTWSNCHVNEKDLNTAVPTNN